MGRTTSHWPWLPSWGHLVGTVTGTRAGSPHRGSRACPLSVGWLSLGASRTGHVLHPWVAFPGSGEGGQAVGSGGNPRQQGLVGGDSGPKDRFGVLSGSASAKEYLFIYSLTCSFIHSTNTVSFRSVLSPGSSGWSQVDHVPSVVEPTASSVEDRQVWEAQRAWLLSPGSRLARPG